MAWPWRSMARFTRTPSSRRSAPTATCFCSPRSPAASRSVRLLDAAQATETVVVVVAPGRRQLALRREHAVGAGVQTDGRAAEHRLPPETDHARDRRGVGHGQRDVLEEARAHDRVGLRQGLEHGRRAVRRVVLAGEEDGLDAEALAGLDTPDYLDELVAAG